MSVLSAFVTFVSTMPCHTHKLSFSLSVSGSTQNITCSHKTHHYTLLAVAAYARVTDALTDTFIIRERDDLWLWVTCLIVALTSNTITTSNIPARTTTAIAPVVLNRRATQH